MQTYFTAIRTFTAFSAFILGVCACPTPTQSQSLSKNIIRNNPKSTFIRGVGLGLFATDPHWNYGPLLDEIKNTGASDVLLVVPLYQKNIHNHDLKLLIGKSPSYTTLLRTLKQVSSRNMRATILVIVRLQERKANEWRGRIQPQKGIDLWFSAYEKHLLELAKIAEQANAHRFIVGSELLSLEKYEQKWRAIIKKVRARFTGKLTYSANWDHFEPILFWDALDEIGVTAYFELVQHLGSVTDAELDQGWQKPRADLQKLKTRFNKPVFMTEIGYPSKASAARYPWDETRNARLDFKLQTQLYQAFCRNFSKAQILDGFFFWNWFGFGGLHDGEYTPRGKPAADALQKCLKNASWDAP